MATTRIEIEQRTADNAAALAARDGEIFGGYLEDVRYLRTRDFTVQREGSDFLVDDKVVDGPTLRALADRERRLSGASSMADQVEAGRKIGDSVPLGRPRRAKSRRAVSPPPAISEVSPRPKAVRTAPRKRPIRTACACGGCIPARLVLEIVADLERLVESLRRR